jgi:hypothetical protein
MARHVYQQADIELVERIENDAKGLAHPGI